LKHFLIALGGNTSAECIVEPALALGKCTRADYTLVRVVRPAFPNLLTHSGAYTGPKPAAGWANIGKIDEQNCLKAEDYLKNVSVHLRKEGATVQTRVHVAEQPAAAILREAALVGADLIALETHGRGVSRLLIGSVADKVVRGSSIPVLVCRLARQAS
jgi:nucleotide-binding universal stress UspA family protein